MSSMLDGDDDDRSAISSLILTPSGQDSPREDLVTNKLIKFDVSFTKNESHTRNFQNPHVLTSLRSITNLLPF
jgi:hypothetical protein